VSDEERIYEDDERHRRWAEGCRRETAIRELLKRHEGKRLNSSDVADVAWELGVSRATLYRLIDAYRAAQTVKALEPRSRGRRQGTFVLDKAREALIAKTIREIYLHPSRPTLTYLVEQVHARFATKGWPAPDRRTVKARVDAIDRRVRALKRRDTQGIKATRAVPGEYVATRPLEIVQIDHTQVDIFLVDEVTRKPIERRPWLTLAIDIFTRMVTGFHLSLDPPSRVSVGLCMLHAVYDKTTWLQERGIDTVWPVAGLPETVHVDNGADFRSRTFVGACRNEGIATVWRPPGTPHYGGHIERLIGTMMGRVHLLPGSTGSNLSQRGKIDPQKVSALTLRELECIIGWEIAGRYHHEIHRALQRPPIAVWRENEASLMLRMPLDRMAFWVSFLPDVHRKLRPDGVHLHGIAYWSTVLSADVGRLDQEVLIKYDPRDVSRIFVQRPSGHFVEARTRNLAFPSLTLREWTAAQHRQRATGRAERNTDHLHRTALAQRRIIDEAIQKTAQARQRPMHALNSFGDGVEFGSLKGIDSRQPTALEAAESRQHDRHASPPDRGCRTGPDQT
jgi:putative transposase